MKCCICGPVKNCGPYLEKVLKNVEKIGSLFEDYKIIIYYDKSNDNSLQKLMELKRRNPRLILHINQTPTSPYRTHRLATARNFCLDYVKQHSEEYPVFIMMDFDDVNAKNVRLDVIKKYLNRDDWDCLSFNTTPRYYDIWALSIYPYCFSYNHFPNNEYHSYNVLQNYVEQKLNELKPNHLLPCISSFNGFAIYRTSKFMNSQYDGRVRYDLLPKNHLLSHMVASKSTIMVFPDFGHLNALYEDCEHRAFHITAINKDNAKIMISPEKVFYT